MPSMLLANARYEQQGMRSHPPDKLGGFLEWEGGQRFGQVEYISLTSVFQICGFVRGAAIPFQQLVPSVAENDILLATPWWKEKVGTVRIAQAWIAQISNFCASSGDN
ncbi:hypothetical protein H072_9684 [Dactylellina haptotyla CBS 200.50]|uniref:Uncharacterized protein n=1 Tax=Dactylellina haptotyla (strain CBS 200.50) TaxID=1284197 RepID=S8A1B2_DACHA|nr:hypothetical protein H072_9684 [Dactylellina haptotyla CBS 200.50]